ncbi:MAG: hypothetical protein FD131_1035 [Rhodocyclaceae bacterium]|nr:MAG: hypothetical protein FD131_1035 [Rhodocyclaceae bacterium]
MKAASCVFLTIKIDAMDYDNPAARLLTVLEEGQKLNAQGSCRAAWDELLKAQGNQALLMSRLGKVMELPQHIIQAIEENYPSHRKHAAHWESQVNAGFTHQSLGSNWQSFMGHIDSHTLSYLAMTSELLQQKSNTKSIEDASILEARNKLEELYKEIRSADIPTEIRLYLIRHLRQILESIDEYFITGALPILDTTGTLLGHALIDEKYRNFLRDEAIGARIFECLTAMANVVGVAVGIPQLSVAIAAIQPLLPQ